ncbi:helix-turn-helix domain-containing protein [Sulfitobacter sp. 1A13421]|uniref:helix-turn-helix domain-containing protein n=1 Tax=Sulfitobacter sp. 1A13421 TaxID=3368595 RepID=UPI0037455B78
MAGAVYSSTYELFRRQLINVRREANLSQAALAKMLNKPPSFVAKYELGERRLDVVEMCVILNCIQVDICEFLQPLIKDAPTTLS